ncbi:MAG: hypothetical protein AAB333_06420, partial [Pseudomonadota bacterium]
MKPGGVNDTRISYTGIELTAVIISVIRPWGGNSPGLPFYKRLDIVAARHAGTEYTVDVVPDTMLSPVTGADDFFNERIMGGKCINVRIAVNRRSPHFEKRYWARV